MGKKEQAEFKAKAREIEAEKLKIQRELENSKENSSKSKFDDMISDDDDDDDEGIEAMKTTQAEEIKRLSSSESEDEERGEVPLLSKEEILEEMTFVLKRAMTEILPEVTKSESEKNKKPGFLSVLSYGLSDEESDADKS